MTGESASTPERLNAPPSAVAADPQAPAPQGLWERLRQHKVVQWTLAYAAAAYTLLHGAGMLSEAQDWPHVVVRVLSIVLIAGVPVVATLAWYHGARGLRRVGAGELLIITLLGVIAGSVLWSIETSREKETRDRKVEIGQSPAVAESASLPKPVVAAVPDRPPTNSVAVLAFTNITGDPTKEYIGDGLSEEIINELAQVEGLKVPARTSSFAYKGRSPDARQIGRDLGVANILEGSVRTEGKRIRVTAQLINAQDGLHVWSKTYEEELTGIFKLQEDLARSIAAALKVNLAESGSPAGALTQNLEAYQLYLQAKAVAGTGTVDSAAAGIALARQAVAKDPSFARAHALLANLRIGDLRLDNAPGLGQAVTDAIAETRHEAMLALELEPRQPSALSSLALIETLEGHWIDAEKYYREGLSGDPSDPFKHLVYANSQLSAVGHLGQALEESRTAYRLGPALPVMSMQLGLLLGREGLEAEASKYLDQAVRLGVSAERAHALQMYSGHAAEQGDLQDAAHRLALSFPTALQSAALQEALRDILRAVRDPSRRPGASKKLLAIVAAADESQLDPATSAIIAWWYARGGDPDAAFAQVDKSLDRLVRSGYPGYGPLATLIWSPAFRQDPRFGKLVSRLGMMNYWKQYGPPDDCELKDEKLKCH